MSDTTPVFTNNSVEPSTLPDFQAVTFNPVAPAYRTYAQLTTAVFWLVLILILQLVGWLPFWAFVPPWWVSAALAGFLLLNVPLVILDARHRGWALREHDLVYRHGVIWRKTIILPFARIQHVETASGPLERWFDLMRVKCFTAGGSTGDLTVIGLCSDDAGRVRQYLLEQIRERGGEQPDGQVPNGGVSHDED